MSGRFITVEGGEGVGKSHFSNLLVQQLAAAKIAHIRTFEPGGTPVAVKLRELFLNPPSDDPLLIETEFCMMSAARVQHVGRKIKPALTSGQWVLCDRFADSSRVYQGLMAGIDEKSMEPIIDFTTFGLSPDVTFILDCDVDTSMKRLGARSAKSGSDDPSRFDKGSRDFHQKIRDAFLSLKKRFPKRIEVLDASQSPEKVAAKAWAIIEERFL